MKGLLVKKLVMTQAILETGQAKPVTVLQAHPNVIKQIKTIEKDGYFALKLGMLAKPNHANPQPRFRKLTEFGFPEGEYKLGDKVGLEIFEVGDEVEVTAISKGHGFAGTVKRHGFHRGPMSHGHDHHRAPGSIGPMGMPRVQKGRRMGGHMGATNITVKNLKVVAVDIANHLIAVSGSIPGANKGIVKLSKNG